jgi:hypothetical protein
VTEEELDAIEARANAATTGPWVLGYHGRGYTICCDADGTTIVSAPDAQDEDLSEDEVFIAAARSDVPALIAELRAAREKLKGVAGIADKWRSAVDDGTWFADGYDADPDGVLGECADELKSVLRGPK